MISLRHIAVYGISLPTFAVSPSVAKGTVYMPSQVAARMLGGRSAHIAPPATQQPESGKQETSTATPSQHSEV